MRPELLTVVVLPDADHRMQVDDRLAEGYLGSLSAFVRSAAS